MAGILEATDKNRYKLLVMCSFPFNGAIVCNAQSHTYHLEPTREDEEERFAEFVAKWHP